jgi:FMN phosphatase YigB (HAD superfamily)
VNHAFLSYAIGLLKPDSKCFFHVIETLGVCPGDVLYVDDSAENVRVALSLGIKAHHFVESVSAETFIRETVDIGSRSHPGVSKRRAFPLSNGEDLKNRATRSRLP